jgi:hypothetical protein
MTFRSFRIAVPFAILVGIGACSGAVVTYPAPDGIQPAPDFQVTLDGKGAFVYDSAVAPYVHFSFSGRAKVTVTLRPDVTFGEDFKYTAWGETFRPQPFRAPVRDLEIRPRSLGVKPVAAGNRITFEIDRPANLSVEINRNLSRPLLIFASPMEKDPPKPDDRGVRYFAPGKVYDTGRIQLQDDETVYIAGGAIVRGSIVAQGISNARVRGRGILDGGDRKKVPGPLVSVERSRNVQVEGIVILNEQGWTVIPRHSEDVGFHNIKMIAWDNNSDGIDVVGSKRVRITRSFLRNNDDCIAIKAMGEAADTDVAGVEVTDTVFWNAGAGNAMEIGYELRTKSIRDILVRNCDVIHAEGAALSVHNADWTTVSNVRYDDIRVEDAPKRLIDVAIGLSIYSIDCPWKYNRQNPQREPVPQAMRSPRGAWFRLPGDNPQERQRKRGRVAGIYLRNIRIHTTAPAICNLIGYDENHTVRDVTVEGLWFDDKPILSAEQAGCRLEFAKDVRFLPAK